LIRRKEIIRVPAPPNIMDRAIPFVKTQKGVSATTPQKFAFHMLVRHNKRREETNIPPAVKDL
jgi:hypothetical protein